MNSVILTQQGGNEKQVTMTSLAIVEYINTWRSEGDKHGQLRHADFITKVPKVLGELSEKFRSVYKDATGRSLPCYEFQKREACLMAMSYSYELQAKVFDHMTALEDALKQKQVQQSDLLTNPQLLRDMLLSYADQNIQLQQQVAVLEPKAVALETIANTSNTYCIRECAKTICIKESELIKLLIDKGWCYRDASKKLQPSAQFVQNQVFVNRTSPVITNTNDGQERVFLHMRVTAFGLTRITGLVNRMRDQGVMA